MDNSLMSWTNSTLNFWVGCDHVSPGCDHCYMYTSQYRYGQDPTTVRRTSPATWKAASRWNKQARATGEFWPVFTCSWSDFFHKAADSWRAEAWQIIKETPALTYQILTKRPGGIPYCLPPDWGDGYPHCWLGVSVE